MPPRKNTNASSGANQEAAKPSAGADVSMISNATTTEPTSPKQKKTKTTQQGDDMIIDDLLLPRSLISRISRGVLPPNTSIQKDAILALAKSATVFISHLAAEANDLTDRKTVQSQDVLKAIKEIEMDSVMGLGSTGSDGRTGGRLEREVNMFEEMVRDKRKGYRDKVKKSRESEVSKPGDDSTLAMENGEEGEEEDRGHQSKKIRRDNEDHLLQDTDMGGVGQASSSSPNQRRINGSDSIAQPDEDGDQTETDPEMADNHGEDEDSEDDEENEEEEEEDEEDEPVPDDELSEGTASRSRLKDGERLLVPDGTVEEGSDEDEDSD